MKLIKLTFTLSLALLLGSKGAKAQLFISQGTDFMIEDGAVVSVQDYVESEVDILSGPVLHNGLLLLNGSNSQNLNMNGFNIPNLELDNNSGAVLGGNAKLSRSMVFTLGKATLHDFNFQLSDIATITGEGDNKYFETNAAGELQKRVSANLASYKMPVGNSGFYNPLFATTAGPYTPDAVFGVRDTVDVHPKKFAQSTDFLENFWPITQAGITKLDARGNYIDPVQVTGSDLKFGGFFWQDELKEWSQTGANVDAPNNLAGTTITGNGDLYAMNNYGLVNAKVFLQGAYNPVIHLMRDNLRTNGNVIPSTDPYRVAPLMANFNHVNNQKTETITDHATVFANQALVDNDIVDWVFLQLRNTPQGNNIIATRSALVQRDGDIVDVDGVSPVYFKDVAVGSGYTLAVRHRNHLGISTTPATVEVSLTAPPLVDFTTMTDAQIFGPATAFKIAADNRNVLWGGNVNFNNNTRYNGIANDKDRLLNALNGNPDASIPNVYSVADVNMNKVVRFNGIANDKDFILNVLDGNPDASIFQFLPQ
ncbi:MAG: hypothetical protein IPJ81_05595 [Chitinophagaceae bacterium]|nr:hypothetical protein [Chitinophagaceae bacterium]